MSLCTLTLSYLINRKKMHQQMKMQNKKTEKLKF